MINFYCGKQISQPVTVRNPGSELVEVGKTDFGRHFFRHYQHKMCVRNCQSLALVGVSRRTTEEPRAIRGSHFSKMRVKYLFQLIRLPRLFSH